jgi:hypothetical protein
VFLYLKSLILSSGHNLLYQGIAFKVDNDLYISICFLISTMFQLNCGEICKIIQITLEYLWRFNNKETHLHDGHYKARAKNPRVAMLTKTDEKLWNYPKSSGLSPNFGEKLLFCVIFYFLINKKWWFNILQVVHITRYR